MEKENIKKNLDSSINEILIKYFDLVEEYIEIFKKNIKNINLSVKKFIFNKGLNCIIVIYNLLLIHTNNLNFVYYTTKKGIYYYIEFIEQSLLKNNLNLNLSSHDAILFVYKKTINNIKPNIKVNKIYNKIKILLDFYNYFLIENIDDTEIISKETLNNIKEIFIEICKLKSIKKINTIINNSINKKKIYQLQFYI
jgi:hypothetical protein